MIQGGYSVSSPYGSGTRGQVTLLEACPIRVLARVLQSARSGKGREQMTRMRLPHATVSTSMEDTS